MNLYESIKNSFKETAPLEKRKPYNVFVVGDHVKIKDGDFTKYHTDNANKFFLDKVVGKTGRISDSYYIGELQQFEVTYDEPFAGPYGTETTCNQLTVNDLEFCDDEIKESDEKKKKYTLDDFDTLEDAVNKLRELKGIEYFTKEEWDAIGPDDINTCNWYIQDIIDNYLNESEEDGGYEEIDSKYVEDSSGFTTQYTMYKAPNGKYVFVFGDKDLYRPEDEDFDWEADSEEEAREWFNSYNGFSGMDEAEEPDTRKRKIVSLSNQLKRVCDEIENIAEMYDETAGDEEDVFAGTEDEYALEMLDQHLGEIFLNDPVLSRLDDGKMTDIISEIMNYIVNGYSVDFRIFLGILKKYKAFEGVLERMEV